MQSLSAASHDIAVIGGGIVGLWTAFEAARQGRSVVLMEKRHIGAGASGGLLGALMPHQATSWNAKKQFQLDGLLTLEDEIAALEHLTGMTTGYRRCGRLMPIRNAEKRRQSDEWAEASHDAWPYPYRWMVAEATIYSGWLSPTEMPLGTNADNLSARVDPRSLIAALKKALELSGVAIREETGVRFDENRKPVLPDGTPVAAGKAIISAGWETFGLVDPGFGEPTGRGVKGQAALLRPAKPVDTVQPILYDNGVYVIAHDNGLIAVGSTSEDNFEDPASVDDKLDAVIERARLLCPALVGAEVVERWAGIRPRASGREPLVGTLPGYANTLIAAGGFKISFAIAHLMAKAVLAQADGAKPGLLPEIFLPENRLKPRRD
ncbi:MAG: D-amino-acid oxidase [Ahrensia sp.]|nr:D-amino-acid oxidase [Ahrensia sp.]